MAGTNTTVECGSEMIFVELAIAVVLLLTSVCILNNKNLIPGTGRYIDKERERQIALEITMTRQNLVLSRLRLKESENIDRILALPAPRRAEPEVVGGSNETEREVAGNVTSYEQNGYGGENSERSDA